MDDHTHAVATISRQIKHFHSQNQPFRISHGSTNSTRPTSDKTSTVSTAALNHVIRVDSSSQIALVEPNVPMDALVSATLKYGLIPPVVMEFPGITVGGGYSGTSGESSSFKHGFFNETLNWVELVLGNGEVVRASREENADLFFGAAGACGTLGVMTLCELRLVPARKFVETTYLPVSSVDEAVETVERLTGHDDIDYLDGIMFSESNGAVVVGRLTDRPASSSSEIRTYTKASDSWFYRHVQTLTRATLTNNEHTSAPISLPTLKRTLGFSEPPQTTSTQPHKELIPTPSYLFRYDRAGFWVGRSAFAYFIDIIPFNRFTRWFLDDFMRTRMLYKALHASGYSERYVVQDCAVPYARAGEFVEWCSSETGIWPLWLCPLREPEKLGGVDGVGEKGTFHPSTPDKQTGKWRPMLNIGLWGRPPASALKSEDAWISLNRRLEAELHRCEGRKWLYAHSYYPREEFWSSYGWKWYKTLRERWHASTLPVVWDKVSSKTKVGEEQGWGAIILGMWPLTGLYGVLAAMMSGEFLKARGSWWHPEL